MLNEEDIKKILTNAIENVLKGQLEPDGKDQGTDKNVGAWKKGDKLYFILSNNRVDDDTYLGTSIDEARLSVGNCFESKEEAEKALEWLKAFKTLRDDSKGYKFVEGEKNYHVEWCYDCKELETDYNCVYHSHLIYFKTEEDTKASIKEHGKEWKIFLGISD